MKKLDYWYDDDDNSDDDEEKIQDRWYVFLYSNLLETNNFRGQKCLESEVFVVENIHSHKFHLSDISAHETFFSKKVKDIQLYGYVAISLYNFCNVHRTKHRNRRGTTDCLPVLVICITTKGSFIHSIPPFTQFNLNTIHKKLGVAIVRRIIAW